MDAKAIWQAGVDAVDSKQLTEAAITYTQQSLKSASNTPSHATSRVFVIGAGMETVWLAGHHCLGRLRAFSFRRVNVPDDCVEALPNITLHGTRPAGVNEPTDQGVQGTSKIIGFCNGQGY